MDQGNGWVKLYRKILDSPVWRARNQAQGRVAITCLLMANHEPARLSIGGEIVELQPGEFWTSLPALADRARVSIKQVRNSLVNLQKLNFLADKGTANGRKISIINWASYQISENQEGRQEGRVGADLGQTDGSKQEGKNERREEVREEKDIPPTPLKGEVRVDKPVKKGRAKPAIETMPEDDYFALVNAHYKNLKIQDGQGVWVPGETLKRWLGAYDRINVDGQVRMSKQWLLDHAEEPKKRRHNLNAFIAGWLGRAQTEAEQKGTCHKELDEGSEEEFEKTRAMVMRWEKEDQLAAEKAKHD